MERIGKRYNESAKSLMGMALGIENKLVYSLSQRATPLVPMLAIGTPRYAGNFGDPKMVSNQFFSEPSVDSRAHGARARDEWSKEKWQKGRKDDHNR